MDLGACKDYIYKTFDQSALPSLVKYIEIPNLSRDYDPNYATNGLLEQAAEHIKLWVEGLGIEGLKTQIIKHQGYTPLIFTEIKGDLPQTILYYGHFDKQPPFEGWSAGLGPTTPVIKDGKLYGRGGADDGYSTYSTMLSIKALQQQKVKIPRCVMITEGDQESGGHIEYYIPALKEKIGNPLVFFCLDSGTCDYQTFCLTTSLRGGVAGTLKVDQLSQGVHSGDAGGIVPSTFRIIRQLMSRIENEETGQCHQDFQAPIPPERYQQAYEFAKQKGKDLSDVLPFLPGVKPISEDHLELVLNRGWRAQLEVVGADGLPPTATAGNVMRPSTTVKISMRVPPTKNHKQAEAIFKKKLTQNPPYNAKINLETASWGGWSAPSFEPFLMQAIDEAAKHYFGTKKQMLAEGGSIPLMNLLQELWPKAQFMITGVLGPLSNAHGPDEFLHLEYCRKLTCCMAFILYKTSLHFQKAKKEK